MNVQTSFVDGVNSIKRFSNLKCSRSLPYLFLSPNIECLCERGMLADASGRKSRSGFPSGASLLPS